MHLESKLEHLVWGPMLTAQDSDPMRALQDRNPTPQADWESVCFRALLCDLKPRFILKGRVGRSYRSVARNGRVLLASNLPLDALKDCEAGIRLQPWRKTILPGDRPEVYVVLLCVHCLDPGDHFPLGRQAANAMLQSNLVKSCPDIFDLAIDVGGGMSLIFFSPFARD